MDEAPLGDFEQTFSTNVVGMIAASAPSCRPCERPAAATSCCSPPARVIPIPRPEVRSLAYQLSKFAVEGLVNGLAVQLRGSGINVNGFRPGRPRPAPTSVRDSNSATAGAGRRPVLFLCDLAPGELSGYVLESSSSSAASGRFAATTRSPDAPAGAPTSP